MSYKKLLFVVITTGGEFKKNSSVRTWLYKITINLCKDQLKSAYSRRIQLTEYVHKYTKRKNHSAEEMVMSQNESDILIKKVLDLPLKYREVIMLYYFQDIKIKEVSEALALSPNTTKTRLRRAKELLKEGMIELE